MGRLSIVDTLVPGAGLTIDGRFWPGAALLAPAVVVLSALVLAILVGGGVAEWVLPRALPVYALLAAIALLLRWRYARLARIDPVRAKELARTAAKAWLRGQDAEAAAAARELTAAAPEVANAWRLRAMVSGDARAERRAAAIDARVE